MTVARPLAAAARASVVQISVKPNQRAARELIKLMKSPEAKPVIKAKGNDPA